MHLVIALNIPSFSILPFFSGYSCILLTGQFHLMCQQCYQISTDFTFVLVLLFERKGHAFVHLFTAFMQLYQANNGCKNGQPNGNRPPTRPHAKMDGKQVGMAFLSTAMTRSMHKTRPTEVTPILS